MTHAWYSPAGVVSVTALLLGVACQQQPTACHGSLVRSGQAIRLASPDAGTVPNLEPLATLLLELTFAVDDREFTRLCTGTRIAPGVVLTARHCFTKLEPRITIRSGASGEVDECRETQRGSTAHKFHPSLDLSLVFFDDWAPQETVVLATAVPPPGARLWMAGYGLTEDGSTGTLRTIQATLLTEDATTVTVQGDTGGACLGDSGGPLFAMSADGKAAQLGTLQSGSATCLAQDEYVKNIQGRAWLDETVGGIEWQDVIETQ